MKAHESVVYIEGQCIKWSVVQKIRRACGGDWDQTMDAFWKARNAKGENGIVKYVVRGLVKDTKGNQYSLLPSKEVNAGQMELIRIWWETNVHKPKPKNDAIPLRDVFRMLAQ
jgi:hypothetical protein